MREFRVSGCLGSTLRTTQRVETRKHVNAKVEFLGNHTLPLRIIVINESRTQPYTKL